TGPTGGATRVHRSTKPCTACKTRIHHKANKAYSEDMRARVIAEVESGASRRAAAEGFVSVPARRLSGSSAFGRRAAVRLSRGAGASRRWRSMQIFCWVWLRDGQT